MNIFGRDLTLDELRRRTGDLNSVAGIRSVVLDNGVERGVRAIDIRTTRGLELEVLVDRAFDLGGFRLSGVPIGWRSGNGYRHPGLHEHNDEAGLSWLRGLDGLLVSGGLDHTLFAAEVEATQYAYPPKQAVSHGLHGRLSAIPARLLEAREVVEDGRVVLRLRGEVIQATSFGEHLRLTRQIDVDFDGREIRLHDIVDNLGFELTPHMFLYHFNFGWPLIDKGTELIAPIRSIEWISQSADTQGVPYNRFPDPIRGFVEQVYEHELIADAGDTHHVALIRADGQLGVQVSWDAAAMPHFFEWLNLRDGQYAVGLEPSTNHVSGDAAAREAGSMTWLKHGESREYRTTVRVLEGTDETAGARSAIRKIGDQPE